MATPRRKRNNSSMPSQERAEQQEHADSVTRPEDEREEEETRQEESQETITGNDLTNILNAFGKTQREMVETMKELVNSVAVAKQPEQLNNHKQHRSNISHEEFAAVKEAAAGKDPEQKTHSFVTQEDVVAMLERELRRSSEDWKYTPQPPYPSSVMHLAYPKSYETPVFTLFDGRKGSPKEHISRFIDALGPHASDHNLRVREFSKSLTDHAYTWYTKLARNSIHTWDEMAGKFGRKYFQYEEMVTIAQLNNTRQRSGENLVDFIRHFLHYN